MCGLRDSSKKLNSLRYEKLVTRFVAELAVGLANKAGARKRWPSWMARSPPSLDGRGLFTLRSSFWRKALRLCAESTNGAI
jgi:hypothetical protein